MPLDSGVFGSGDPDQIVNDIHTHYQPDDGAGFSIKPSDLPIRVARKLTGDQFKDVDIDKAVAKPKKDTPEPPDLSSFGEEAPKPSSADLPSLGTEQAEQPLGFTGNAVALGKGLLRGAPEAVGSMTQGAAIAAGPLKPEKPAALGLIDELQNSGSMSAGERAKLMGRALRTIGDRGLQMDYNAALQRIARGGDAGAEAQTLRDKFNAQNADQTKPIEEQAKYKAGTAIKEWADKTVPMTEEEQSSVGGRVGTGISSMAPYLAAGVVAGPAAGILMGAAGMGAQTAGDTFQAAKAKGATDDVAARAAGWGGAIGAALGTLPLGVVFKPVEQAAPGMTAWLTAKLVQAGQSGITFATVGEAQEYLLQQVAKEQYDPQAGYSPEAKRVIAGLLTGGALGAMHPLSPKASDLSSPEAVADFIKKAAETRPREPGEPEFGTERGAAWRSEIDDFPQHREQQEATTRRGLRGPDEQPPQSTSGNDPVEPSSPSGGIIQSFQGETAGEPPSAKTEQPSNPASAAEASYVLAAIADATVTDHLRNILNKASRFDKAREKVQDLNVFVNRLQDAVQARMDGELPDSKAFYQKKRLFPGKVATEVEDFNKQHLDPLVDLLKEKGLSLDDVGDIVYAQHAGERNAHIDTINPDAGGRGSGMSDQEAQAILDRHNAADLAEIATRIDGIRKFIHDTMVRNGLESRTTTDAWRAQYRHYAPLGGLAEPREDDLNDTFRESGKFNVRGREVKQAFGRRSRADNPLVNLLDQAYRTIERGKKNEYLQSLAKALLGLDPEGRHGFVQFDRGKPRREIDPVTGLVRSVDDSSFRSKPESVAYKVGGRTRYMVFEQRAMADVLKRMHPDPSWAQALLTFQNKLKAAWTHWSPEFLIRHFLFRYPIEGTLNSFEQGNVPWYMADSIPFLGRASKAIFASQRGEVHSNADVAQYQRYYDEMRQHGGAMAFRQMRDIDMTRDHLDRRLQSLSGRPIATVRDKARAVAEAMDTVTNALDNALRLAAYAEARRQGKTPEQAAVVARDATVDYQQAGKWKNQLALIWPFGNIAAQTGARMASAMTRSRTMRAVFASSVAAGFASAMFNYLIGGDDKDGVPFFDKMPWWQKQLNLTVMNPMHRDDKGRPVPIHIPLPYNWAFPFTIGQALATMAFSKTRGEARKAIAAAIKSGVSAFSPFAEDENQVANISPELLKPLVHTYTNENWTGYPVHLDPAYQKGPRSESGYKTTGEGWKFAATMANAASGGDKRHSGYLDFFPEDLREVTKYYSGLGTLFDLSRHATETAQNAAAGKPVDYSNVPLARVVMGTNYDSSDKSRHREREKLEKRPWER